MNSNRVQLSVFLWCTLSLWSQTGNHSGGAPAVCRVIQFSGILRDAAAKPEPGPVRLVFSLYEDEQAISPLWQEVQYVQVDGHGRYNVFLGAASANGLPLELFATTKAQWLGIRQESSGLEEGPRALLAGITHAVKAADVEVLSGHPASGSLLSESLAQLGIPGGSSTTSLASLSAAARGRTPIGVFANKTSGSGTADFIPLWTGTMTLGDSVIFQSGPFVGVGTQTPVANLDVESASPRAFRAESTATTGLARAMFAETNSTTNGSTAVFGNAAATTGLTFGVQGRTASTDDFATGVSGAATGASGQLIGVRGETESITDGTVGVFGTAPGTSGQTFGVEGQSFSPAGVGVVGFSNGNGGTGVAGKALGTSGSGAGVVGTTASAAGFGGRFANFAGGAVLQGLSTGAVQVFLVDGQGNVTIAGNLNVTGTVSKGGGSFTIDHPLDPELRTLSHSFVESPDMMNVYNGNVVLDRSGEAWVTLPQYFEALNRDFRYQLTSIGTPSPKLHVAHEMIHNRFKIGGGTSGTKVSWQVTGVRRDAYANTHRIRVEEEKPAAERGYYLHPDAFGQPDTKSVHWAHRPSEPGEPEALPLAAK